MDLEWIIYGYDSRRHQTGNKYLHENGSLAVGPDGYARLDYTTDKDGSILSQKFYDPERNPVLKADGADEIDTVWSNRLKKQLKAQCSTMMLKYKSLFIYRHL